MPWGEVRQRNLVAKRRLMVFVDGTNLLQGLARVLDIPFRADKPPERALNFAVAYVDHACDNISFSLIRKYWFGSYKGTEEYCLQLREYLRKNGFEPILFRRKDGREKGVDIALTKQMLVNAFNQNFDTAILVAGDEDYVELVREVKRYGPQVYGTYFPSKHGLSDELRLAFDDFEILATKISQIKFEELKKRFRAEMSK